jgi:hypothetical protein
MKKVINFQNIKKLFKTNRIILNFIQTKSFIKSPKIFYNTEEDSHSDFKTVRKVTSQEEILNHLIEEAKDEIKSDKIVLYMKG